MADRNLVLQLLITAKDQASGVFSKLFSSLNDGTNVIAGKVRDGFSNLFGGAVDSAAAFEQQLGKVQADVQPLRPDVLAVEFGRWTLEPQAVSLHVDVRLEPENNLD